jgi:hypothetical protein
LHFVEDYLLYTGPQRLGVLLGSAEYVKIIEGVIPPVAYRLSVLQQGTFAYLPRTGQDHDPMFGESSSEERRYPSLEVYEFVV